MKTTLKHRALLLWFLLPSLVNFAQQKQIKVQIMHEGMVMVDTTIYRTSDEAKVIIENMVQRFTTDPVTIDTKLTHGLYVFNITNESWKEQESSQKQVSYTEPDKSTEAKTLIEPTNTKADTVLELNNEPFEVEPSTKNTEPNEAQGYDDIEVDSLYREFSKELDMHWNEAHIDINMDSVGTSFKQFWNEIKSGNFQNDPDLKNLKNDFETLFDKIITTQIIIIQNSDTLKID